MRYTWILKAFWKEFSFQISRPYHLVRTAYPVWFNILNREARKLYEDEPPALNTVAERIVRDLKSTGIAVAHLEELFPGADLLGQLQKHAQKLLESAKIKKGKEFLLQLTELRPVLNFNDPLVQLALAPNVLNIVNAYLEIFAKFKTFSLNLTLTMPLNSPATKSQRWHRDPEDKKMCKMFVYLSDVDENSGPFIYIPESHYGGKWRKVFPQRPPRGYYPPDGAVERVIPAEAIKKMTGRAGTILFGDPSGLHKGGYALGRERLMFTVTFASSASLLKTFYSLPDNFKEQAKKLTAAQKYALTS